MSSGRRMTYVEISASSMVPGEKFEGHEGSQNLSAHSLVGVACGRGGFVRENKKLLILKWRFDNDFLYNCRSYSDKYCGWRERRGKG